MKRKKNLILQLTLLSLVLNIASLLFSCINSEQPTKFSETKEVSLTEKKKTERESEFQQANREYVCNVIFV